MQVTDIITPLIAAIWGGENFAQLYFTVHNSKFLYGDLINQASRTIAANAPIQCNYSMAVRGACSRKGGVIISSFV